MAVNENEVRKRAHQIWLRAGQPKGEDEYHWRLALAAIRRGDPSPTIHPYGDRMFRDGAWEALVARYADGRPLCNCRQAYYDSDGQCMGGCSSNISAAKGLIAEQVLRDLSTRP